MLGGAAGELAGVAGEGLGGQVDALADGQVRVPAVGELLDGESGLDGVTTRQSP